MGHLISHFAFTPEKCTYSLDIDYLLFIPRDEHYIPVRHLHVNHKYPTLLMCHGNTADIGNYNLNLLSQLYCANICIFDYAGYGLHTNTCPSEEDTFKDARAVYHYLINNNINNIIIYGKSLGTGVACQLAYEVQTDKLILVSPFLSARQVGTNVWIPGDIFKNDKIASCIYSKTLIIHGTSDHLVTYCHGYYLSKKFKNLYYFYPLQGCGHNDMYNDEFFTCIKAFIHK